MLGLNSRTASSCKQTIWLVPMFKALIVFRNWPAKLQLLLPLSVFIIHYYFEVAKRDQEIDKSRGHLTTKLEKAKVEQTAGERENKKLLFHHRRIAILWRIALPQSLLLFILEWIFFQNISQKNHSHIVLVGMHVWCIRLCPISFNWKKANTTEAACVAALLLFLPFSRTGRRDISDFCCKN